MITPKYLTEDQVSVLTNIAVKTLQCMRYKRTGLPFVKIGRLVRYDLDDIYKYMKKHRIKSCDKDIKG